MRHETREAPRCGDVHRSCAPRRLLALQALQSLSAPPEGRQTPRAPRPMLLLRVLAPPGLVHSAETGFTGERSGSATTRSLFLRYGAIIVAHGCYSAYTAAERSRFAATRSSFLRAVYGAYTLQGAGSRRRDTVVRRHSTPLLLLNNMCLHPRALLSCCYCCFIMSLKRGKCPKRISLGSSPPFSWSACRQRREVAPLPAARGLSFE
jgi:hypothetical protein